MASSTSCVTDGVISPPRPRRPGASICSAACARSSRRPRSPSASLPESIPRWRRSVRTSLARHLVVRVRPGWSHRTRRSAPSSPTRHHDAWPDRPSRARPSTPGRPDRGSSSRRTCRLPDRARRSGSTVGRRRPRRSHQRAGACDRRLARHRYQQPGERDVRPSVALGDPPETCEHSIALGRLGILHPARQILQVIDVRQIRRHRLHRGHSARSSRIFGALMSSTPRHFATLITLLLPVRPGVGRQVGVRASPRSRNLDLDRYVRCWCDELESTAEDGHRGGASRERTRPGRACHPRRDLAADAVGLRAGQEEPGPRRRRANRERRRLEHRPPTASQLHRTPSAAGIPIPVHCPRPAVAPRSPRMLPHDQVLRPHRRQQRTSSGGTSPIRADRKLVYERLLTYGSRGEPASSTSTARC